MICEIEDSCCMIGERARCGHCACADHTDGATELCLRCVPCSDEDYMAQVLMAELCPDMRKAARA